MSKQYTLNQGQKDIAEKFFQFLFEDGKELNISGAGGTGKTVLMSYLIHETIPRYTEICKIMGLIPEYDEAILTATTNKAAQVLSIETGQCTETIHSFLNLKVKDDYNTGESKLVKTSSWKVYTNLIIFIDEASMIDNQLLGLIRESTLNCKIIYVGDHCQLAPVKASISPVYKLNIPMYVLTEQMRNQKQPALMNICAQLRDTVETGKFYPIKVVPGVIDWLSGSEMEQEVINHFTQYNSNYRILGYTNQCVVAYNSYIRQLRQLTDTYTVGEELINNSGIQFNEGIRYIPVEEELTVKYVSPDIVEVELEPGVIMETRECTLANSYGISHANILLPENKEHFTALMKYYAKQKNWPIYYKLKNYFPDLRPKDAVTIHKIQGSTLDTVFIDVSDLSICKVPTTVARLLYVAVSRAKNRIVLYGNLDKKYGGIVR